MTPSGADEVSGANALPIRLVMLATALALALIASMGWYVWNSVRVLHTVQLRTFRLLKLTGDVAYLDEAVSASARLRVSTSEERWPVRYRDLLASRAAALAEFHAVAPEICTSPAAVQLLAANAKLLKMEDR